MRIERLELLKYGPFTDIAFDFSKDSAGVQIIYGDNEAGKSSSLRGLISLLYGVPARTTDDFIHGKSQLRIGGLLSTTKGDMIRFIRRKGNKNTLIDPDTNSYLQDDAISPFLPAAVTQELFEQLYGIDYQRLLAGGQQLLNQSGHLGQALFSAASGIAGIRETLNALQTKANTIYRPGRAGSLVKDDLAQMKSAQARAKDATLKLKDWKSLQASLEETRILLEEVDGALVHLKGKQNKLARISKVAPTLAERTELLIQLAKLDDVLVLPENFGNESAHKIEMLANARERQEKAKTRQARLTNERDSLSVNETLIERGSEIEAIFKDSGAVEKSIADRPRQETLQRTARVEAEKELKIIRPDLDFDTAAVQLKPLFAKQKLLTSLITEYARISDRIETLNTSMRKTDRKKITIESKLAKIEVSDVELNTLKACIVEARKAGEIDTRISEMNLRVANETQTCDEEFKRLGRFQDDRAALLTTSLPVSETLNQFELRFASIDAEIRDCRRQALEAETKLADTTESLSKLLRQHEIPTIDELKALRVSRGISWHLVKKKYVEQVAVDSQIVAHAGDADLVQYYENQIISADNLSDALREDAKNVAHRVNLEVQKMTLSERLQKVQSKAAVLEENRVALDTEWREIWKSLGIAPATPVEMKQWVVQAEKLMGNMIQARNIADECSRLIEKRNSLKSILLSVMKDVKIGFKEQSDGLEAILARCEQFVKAEESAVEERKSLERSLIDLNMELTQLSDERKDLEQKLLDWKRKWGEVVSDLGLDSDAAPELGQGRFEVAERFFEQHEKFDEARRRIYGMDKDIERFEQKLNSFTSEIKFSHENLDAIAVAKKLYDALNKAKESDVKLTGILSQLDETASEIDDAGISIMALEKQLEQLRSQAKVTSNDDLIVVAAASDKKRNLQSTVEQLTREAIKIGDGLSIEELEKEAEGRHGEDVPGELFGVESEISDHEAKRDQLRDNLKELQIQSNAKDGSSVAAAAMEDAEECLASVRINIERYMRLRIAASILENRIETYRKQNQGPILKRAGKIFAELTLGSFKGLRDELDANGSPVLLGVRPDDKETLVAGMSDGTRDQLFLALRLATMEQQIQKGEPMPLVMDDILIGFDDNRTQVCLKILSELAAKTQVLLFTHQRSVVEIARALDDGTNAVIHELHRSIV
ncbi:MAG: AAA family ATPase [Deltaproteobacteria bacterium]|nr:AAA family ATPase [Deltaproteobacteria bacterium]